MDSNLQKVDVIVVGAGITGLSTAYAVKKAGRSVLVLEASDQVGGRIMTRERGGDRVEVGQQYLLSNYEHALALVEELGMTGELIEAPPEIMQHIDRKGKAHVVDGDASLLRLLGVRGAADLARAAAQYSALGKSFSTYDLDVDIPEYDNVPALEGFSWAGQSFTDYILRPVCYGNAGTALEHISLYDAIRLFRSNLKHPKYYGFRAGNAALPQKLAEHVPVMLNARVGGLRMAGDRVSGVELADGRAIEAGHVILCTTPGAAASIVPQSFAAAKRFLTGFHHTPLALAFFYLDRPFDSPGFSFGIAYPEKRYFNLSINHTAVRPFLVPSGKAIISAWSAYPGAGEMLAKPDEEILARALDELKLFYPGLRADWVEHAEVIRHDWGYAHHLPGDFKRIMDFNTEAKGCKGLSFANADYNRIALESGIIMGKRAAARAVECLSALV